MSFKENIDNQNNTLDNAPDNNDKEIIEAVQDNEEYTDINEALENSSDHNFDKKHKMEEIYSTKDKHVKYKRQTPIEAEQAAKRRQKSKEELLAGKAEIDLDHEDRTLVTLEAELEDGTIVSDEIIENLSPVSNMHNVYVQDIDGIDVDLDSNEALRLYEKKANDTSRHDKRSHKPDVSYKESLEEQGYTEQIVSKVPCYKHESKENQIRVKAGRFTDVVESEYDEYLQSNDPTISKNYHDLQKSIGIRQSLLYTLSKMASKGKIGQEKKPDQLQRKTEKEKTEVKIEKQEIERKITTNPENKLTSQENNKKPKKPSKIKRFFKAFGGAFLETFTVKRKSFNKDILRSSDYETKQDEKYVLSQTKANIKKLSLHLAAFGVIGAVMLALVFLQRIQKSKIFENIMPNGALFYCIINLLLLIICGVVGRAYIFNGIKSLKRLKGNCDTLMSLSFIACVLQGIASLFTADSFVNNEAHLYGFLAVFALICNTIGRLLSAVRVKKNFAFLTSRSPAYVGKILNDEETARRMISGTTAQKGIVAYQHITSFLSDFLKISYAPDPSEEISSKLAPITMVSTLFVSVLYTILNPSVHGAFSVLAVMLCISIPFCSLLAGNIPMLLFSGKTLKYNAMVAGYPSIKQFGDTSSIMVSAKELFPQGSIKLEELKTFVEFRTDEILLSAAVVLKEANSPLDQLLYDKIKQNSSILPKVESVLYEEKSGLVGWVNGERVLIGNKILMKRYHIKVEENIREEYYKKQQKQIVYIAYSGQLAAMLVADYNASPVIQEALQNGEKNGLSFLVGTTDPNVTAELLAQKFNIFFRSIKILPNGYANVMDEVTSKVDETSRSYLATRGAFSSLSKAVSGCIKLKSNMTMGIVLELFSLVLGVILCATLVLYSSVARLTVLEILIYILFWLFATIITQLIKKP